MKKNPSPFQAISSKLLVAAILVLAAVSSSQAQTTYTFDPAQTPGTPSGGTGAWDTTSVFWENGGTDFVWANGGTDTATFGGTAGTVTLGGTTINVNAINFNTDGYTVTGGTLNFSGATPTITSAASVSTDLTSTLTGTTGLTLAGTGTLIIDNAGNSLSGGISLDAGKLVTSTAGSLGTNLLTLNGGTFVPRANLTNDILVTNDSNIDISGTSSTYTLGDLSIGNQTLSLLVSSWNNGVVSFGNTTLTGDATIRTSKGSSSTTESIPTAIFDDVSVGDSVATATTTTLTMSSTSGGVNRDRVMNLNGVLSDNASDGTKILALAVDAGYNASLIVNVGGVNTYTGGTSISGESSYYAATGTLRLTTGNDRLPTGTILTINGGSKAAGVLDLNSYDQTVGGLVGGSGTIQGSVTNNDSGSGTATLTVSSTTTDSTFEGLITDGDTAKVALTKAGAGTTLTLAGENTYTGATNVDGGTLIVNGGIGVSAATVASGAAIGGSGSMGGDLTLDSGASFVFSLTDTLSVTGTVALDSSFGVASLVNSDLSAVDWSSVDLGTYTLIDTTSTDFAGLGIDNFGSGNAADLGDGKSAYFQSGSLQLVVIPEPSSFLLVSIFMMALLAASRSRKRV